uniref:Uncharacterized protein n=1 Tax=Rhizophora mucronata TaxID=61149 RepID=A0A2P2PD51_RHIMU
MHGLNVHNSMPSTKINNIHQKKVSEEKVRK